MVEATVDRSTKRAEQRRILALLVAIAALVLPVSGAIGYLDLIGEDNGLNRWAAPFIGGAWTSDVVGPVLLAGALGLGILVFRDNSTDGAVTRSLVGTVLAVAALSQAAAFLVTAIDLVTSNSYDVPGEGAWDVYRWATFARLGVQGAVAVAVAAYAMRWLAPDDDRTPS